MSTPTGMDLPLPSYRYSVSTYGGQVRIAGNGDGNGLGMSQYGALGKAEAGWSAPAILGDYYAGTTLGPLPEGEMPATIAVTLRSGAAEADIAADGPVTVVGPGSTALASTSGPAGWVATAAAAGPMLAPSDAVTFPTSVGRVGDVAPIPMRSAPPAVALSSAPAAPGRPPSPVVTTTSPTAPTAPTPRATPRLAAAVSRDPARPPGAGRRLAGPGLAAVTLLIVTVGVAVNKRKIFRYPVLKGGPMALGGRAARNSLQP
jgi:hypothetical protein